MGRFTVFLFVVLLSCGVIGSDGGESRKSERFSSFKVSRRDLNKPVSPFSLYISVATSGGINSRQLRCIISRGYPISPSMLESPTELRKQLIPSSYTWQVLGENGKIEREWLSQFMRNRDETYHTVVKLPEDDLRRSQLVIYFEDVDSNGERDDFRFVVDLSEFDWKSSTRWIFQDLG